MTKYRNALLWFVALSAIVAFAISRFSSGNITVFSDMLSLLGQRTVFDQKIKEIASRQQQKLVIVVAANEQMRAQSVSKQLAIDLIQLDSIKTAIRLPFNQDQINQISALYQHHPFTLLSDEYSDAIQANEPDKLNEYFLASLLQPSNPFVEMTIEQDPTLGLANALQQKLASQSQWSNDGDSLYQQLDKQYYYPLFVELAQAHLGVNQSVAIERQINQLLEKIEVSDDISIYRSGLLFHISGSTVQAQAEITLFGVISSIIILAVTLLVFRSVTPIVVIVLIMSLSMTFGAAGLVSVVDEIHLITFIFAISLIGISVDYAFHVLSAAALTRDNKQSLTRYLAPAMLMGATTTLVGYCAMLLMPINALHQITVFMIFGLTGALATALFWLAPYYNNKNLCFSSATEQFISQLTQRCEPLRRKRYIGGVIGSLAILLLLAGGQFHFDDNVKSLNSSSVELLQQEQKIQQLMGYSSYPRYILVAGDAEETVLNKMQQLTTNLDSIQFDFRAQSLSLWIPSRSKQYKTASQIKAFNDKGELALMQSYLEPQQWQTMLSNLDNPLTSADWPKELMILAQPLWQDDGKIYGMISYYGKLSVKQQQAIKGHLNDISFFDQPQRLSQSLASVRTSLVLFFAIAAIAFAIILVTRYGLKYGLLALVTPVFAAIGSLILSQLIVSNLTIFNLLACLLIVALAVDYIVFFSEQGHKKHVVLAVLLSAISSMSAFGMMTFSQTPAVYHFGLSTLIGIVLAVLLSFITPLRPRKPDDQPM